MTHFSRVKARNCSIIDLQKFCDVPQETVSVFRDHFIESFGHEAYSYLFQRHYDVGDDDVLFKGPDGIPISTYCYYYLFDVSDEDERLEEFGDAYFKFRTAILTQDTEKFSKGTKCLLLGINTEKRVGYLQKGEDKMEVSLDSFQTNDEFVKFTKDVLGVGIAYYSSNHGSQIKYAPVIYVCINEQPTLLQLEFTDYDPSIFEEIFMDSISREEDEDYESSDDDSNDSDDDFDDSDDSDDDSDDDSEAEEESDGESGQRTFQDQASLFTDQRSTCA